jgi:hypothetical protein
MPCFCRQDLNAVKRLDFDFDPGVLVVGVLALVDVVLVELVAELPHAASTRQLPSTARARGARMRRRLVGSVGRGGCMGCFVPLMVWLI